MPVKMIANDIASDYDLPQDRPSITDADLRFIDALLAQGVAADEVAALYQRDESLGVKDLDVIQDYITRKGE